MVSKRAKKVVKKNANKIKFNGRKYKYSNYKDLAKKLRIPPPQARELIRKYNSKKANTRIIAAPDNKILKIDINEKFRGLLEEKFNLKRVYSNKITSTDYNVELKGDYSSNMELSGDAKVSGLLIHVTIYLTWYGADIDDDDIDAIKEEGPNGPTLQDLIDRKIVEKRNFDITYTKNTVNEYPSIPITSEKVKYIKPLIREGAKEYAEKSGAKFILVTANILDSFSHKSLHFKDSILYEKNNQKILKFDDWVNVQYKIDSSSKYSCGVNYLLETYPKIPSSEIISLEKKGGVKIKKLLLFLDIHDIKYKIYGGDSKILYQTFTNIEETKLSYGRLVCIFHNNHFYPVEGIKLMMRNKSYDEVKIVDNAFLVLQEYISSENKVPRCIKLGKVSLDENGKVNLPILSFIGDKIKYIQNPEYNQCIDILKKIGLEKFITDNITLSGLVSILEKEYITKDINSFIPNISRLKTKPYNYQTTIGIDKILSDYQKTKENDNPLLKKDNKNDDKRKICTIDKILCYISSLRSLPYLLSVDWRTCKIKKNPTKIIDHYIYVVEVTDRNILLPDNGVYEGYHLKLCKNIGLDFKLLEEIEATASPNGYTEIIDILLENVDRDTVKKCLNKLIGCFEMDKRISKKFKYESVCNKDFKDRISGDYKKINDEYYLKYTQKNKMESQYTRLPINTQIKNMSRVFNHNKIKELGIKDEDVIQVKTDSISYYGELPNDLDPTRKDINGWKEEKFVPLKNYNTPDKRDIRQITFFPVESTNLQRTLHYRYAGSGKTYEIINYEIPKLQREGKTFIVISPTHKSLKEFRGKYNCEVIQKFTIPREIPEYDHYIFDEWGMADMDAHNLLFTLNKMGKEYSVYADFKQLLPFGEKKEYSTKHYIDLMFNKIDSVFTNNRNNFTKEYYDYLRTAEQSFLINEVIKYSTKKYMDAHVVLCYRNKDKFKTIIDDDGNTIDKNLNTMKKYNDKILKEKGLDRYDVGTRHICVSNEFIELKPNPLYKSTMITIKEIIETEEGIKYKCEDEYENEYLLSKKKMESKKFNLGYSINVHQVQGDSLESYYWAPEDNYFINNRTAYVIISRLKKELTDFTKLSNLQNMTPKFDMDTELYKFEYMMCQKCICNKDACKICQENKNFIPRLDMDKKLGLDKVIDDKNDNVITRNKIINDKLSNQNKRMQKIFYNLFKLEKLEKIEKSSSCKSFEDTEENKTPVEKILSTSEINKNNNKIMAELKNKSPERIMEKIDLYEINSQKIGKKSSRSDREKKIYEIIYKNKFNKLKYDTRNLDELTDEKLQELLDRIDSRIIHLFKHKFNSAQEI